MAGVNKVILIGNLGADPEIRTLESGAMVANFNIATTEYYTNKKGERVDQTEWHRIELWEGLARVAQQHLRKGNQVFIEGRLRTENWTDKEGNSRSRVTVRATNLVMLGSPNPEGSASSGTTRVNPPPAIEGQLPSSLTSPDDEGDLPF